MSVRNPVTPSPWRKSPRFVVAAVAVAVALSGCTSGGSAAVDTPSSSGADATVVRVVDGDTLVASLDGTVETIRLLNVDTPETKKPNTPVQCLGPEATEYLRQRLPAGTGVHLEYDVERTDRYDRTLAGVYLDGDLVNADIAREGLGVAVLFEPNHRFHDEVLAAQQEALEEETGLFSATVECTVPAQIESAIDQLATVPTATAQTSAEASGLLSGAATALAAGKAADLLLGRTDDSGDAVRAVVGSVVAGKLAPRLSKATAAATRQEGILKERRQLLVTREHEAAVKAKAKAEARKKTEAKAAAVAAQQAAAASRAAAAEAARQEKARIAERQRVARQAAQAKEAREAAKRRTRKAPAQAPAAPPATRKVPKKTGTPYPGYTGPRCYAPGGRTWKPCP
ncbi:thermonuclease family protein [Arthrobacter rhombi]|uniref:thermonuclease family protein n=1 Tax=Arthrobacter rhombi TaxID=71253 RepID=UPI003FD656E9